MPSGQFVPVEPDQIVLGRYHLVRQLGVGGMGTVWCARDSVLGRDVAIKVVPIVDALTRARFVREGRLAARLDHRGLCKIYDVGEDEHRGFLVMELLTGSSLYDRAAGNLALADALAIVAEVARAMAHAHDAGLIHRDLKPDNVFLSRQGGDERAVVIDFGLAYAVDGDAQVGRLTSEDVTGGTPTYMSPEQARAAPLTTASDVYALGCVLFELIAERPPFAGAAAVVMSKHVYTAAPSLATVAPGAPPEVALLVSRMLQKAPNDRPSMREVGDACEHAARAVAGGAAAPLGFGRGRLVEPRGHRMVTRTESTHAGPLDPAIGSVELLGDVPDDVMVALAALGIASVRKDEPGAGDVIVVDGPLALLDRALATGRPVIATIDSGDLDGALALARRGAVDVLTRPVAVEVAARKIERRLRRTKAGR